MEADFDFLVVSEQRLVLTWAHCEPHKFRHRCFASVWTPATGQVHPT